MRRAGLDRLRRTGLGLLAAVLLAVLSVGSAAAGTGDRSLVGAAKLTQRPFRSIVLLSVGRDVVCTGFVVARRKVVTAAHCLTRNAAKGDYRFRRGLPGNVRLYRAYSATAGGRTYPTCDVSRVWAHPRFIRRDRRDRVFGSRAHDYAVLTTKAGCSYPRNAVMKLQTTTLAGGELPAGKRIKMAGYPADPRFSGMNGLNLWRTRGRLRSSGGDTRMLYTTGFVARGMSGAPMWRTYGEASPCGRSQCVVGILTECAVNSRGLCKLGDSTRRGVRITPTVRRIIRNH
jgi:V8-like Glu-specific endopeptidase